MDMTQMIWAVPVAIGIVGATWSIYLSCGRHVQNKRTVEVEALPPKDVLGAENLTELGPVNYFANARHGQKDTWFQFKYKKVGNEWLVYILRMPALNGRSGDLHMTHRYHKDGSYWICYDPQPSLLRDAQTISRLWADRELEYIYSGIEFEYQNWDT